MEIKNIEQNKRLNENNIDVMIINNHKLAEKVQECGKFIRQTKQGNNIIYNCCNSKYCYLCSEKKKEHDSKQLKAMLEYALSDNKKIISLTISPFNAYNSDELRELKSKLDKAFKRFVNYKPIKKMLVGSVKKYEIALNKYPTNKSYNLHIHCLLVFNSGWLNPKYYLTASKFKELFDRALQEPFNYDIKLKNVDFSNYEKTAHYFSKSFVSVKEELNKCDSVQVLKTIYSATDKVKMYQVSNGLKPYQEQAKKELESLRESLNEEEQQQECTDYVYSMNNSCYVMYQREPVSEP